MFTYFYTQRLEHKDSYYYIHSLELVQTIEYKGLDFKIMLKNNPDKGSHFEVVPPKTDWFIQVIREYFIEYDQEEYDVLLLAGNKKAIEIDSYLKVMKLSIHDCYKINKIINKKINNCYIYYITIDDLFLKHNKDQIAEYENSYNRPYFLVLKNLPPHVHNFTI